MASEEMVGEPPAQQTPVAEKPLQVKAQLRALLRGNVRVLPQLAEKAITALRARYYLRRCTRVGRYVRIYGRAWVQNEGTIEIGDRVLFVAVTVRSELAAIDGGRLEIGDETFINYGFSAAAHELVRIGKRCLIGPYVNIIDNNFHDIHDRSRKPPSRPVIIGDDVWINARAIILPGVTIGDHAVVGAGAVVTKDVPPRTVVAGNPARIISQF